VLLRSVTYCYTFFNAKVLTSSTTITYSTSPLRFSTWSIADVFVTGRGKWLNAVAVTAQYSADNLNWANATYSYVTQKVQTTATLNTTTQQLVLNSNTTSFLRIPIVGEYLRFRMDNGGYVTVTVKATVKNGTHRSHFPIPLLIGEEETYEADRYVTAGRGAASGFQSGTARSGIRDRCDRSDRAPDQSLLFG
jgi:hypothetical protein